MTNAIWEIPFSRSLSFLLVIHHILIMSLPNVFSWDLLFHISRLTKRPAITVCRCYRGYNIYSHMMASQGDQEVGFF